MALSIIEPIKGCELFAGFSDTELSAIEKSCIIKQHEKDTIVMKSGESRKILFIVLTGKITSTQTMIKSSERKFGDFIPGDFFGEVSFAGNKPVFDTYIASEKSQMLALSEAKIMNLIEEHTVTAVKFITRLLNLTVQRFRHSSRFYSDIMVWGENASRRVITDELTGIYNRTFLEDAIENFFNISQSNNKPLALFMIDLDNFRTINETYGLETGNQILLVLVSVIKNVISRHGIIARYGGDEFSVLLPEADIAKALAIAETIRSTVESFDFSKFTGGNRFPVTTSIGISSFPETASDIHSFKEKADTALYKAKDSGRNRIECIT